MGRILRELLIVGIFLWYIAFQCQMDRVFLVRCLIVSAGFLIVSADSLIVSAGGIREGGDSGKFVNEKYRIFIVWEKSLSLQQRMLRILGVSDWSDRSDWSEVFLRGFWFSDWSDWSDQSDQSEDFKNDFLINN